MAASKKAQDEKNLKVLRQMASLPANKQCFDCGQRGPTYINMTIGTFVCTACSGRLRGLTPPHRVKSISMTTFTQTEMEQVKNGGNEVASVKWMGRWNDRIDKEPDFKEDVAALDFFKDKYVKKRWYTDEPIQDKTKDKQTKPLEPPPTKKSTSSTSVRQRPSGGTAGQTMSNSSSNSSVKQPQTHDTSKNISEILSESVDPFDPPAHSDEKKVKQPPAGAVQVFPGVPEVLKPNQTSKSPSSDSFGAFTSASLIDTKSIDSSASVSTTPSLSIPQTDKYSALADLDVSLKDIKLGTTPPVATQPALPPSQPPGQPPFNPFGGPVPNGIQQPSPWGVQGQVVPPTINPFSTTPVAANPFQANQQGPTNQFGGTQQQFGVPQQQYGGTQQQFGVPQQYGGTQQQFGVPQQQYGGTQQQFGVPQQQFGVPQQQFGVPQQQFGVPQQQYGGTQQQYGGTQQQFGSIQQPFRTQQQFQGSQSSGFQNPGQGMGFAQNQSTSSGQFGQYGQVSGSSSMQYTGGPSQQSKASGQFLQSSPMTTSTTQSSASMGWSSNLQKPAPAASIPSTSVAPSQSPGHWSGSILGSQTDGGKSGNATSNWGGQSGSGTSGWGGQSGSGTSGWGGQSGSGTSGWGGQSGSGTSGWGGQSGSGPSGWGGQSGSGPSGWGGQSGSGTSGWGGQSGSGNQMQNWNSTVPSNISEQGVAQQPRPPQQVPSQQLAWGGSKGASQSGFGSWTSANTAGPSNPFSSPNQKSGQSTNPFL